MRPDKSAATRKRIMDAAARCFSADGYEAAGVNAVCAQAGVSKGAFYYYFESKQALFLSLLQDWLAELDKAIRAASKPSIPETLVHLSTMMPLIVASAPHRLSLWLEFWLQASRDKAVWKLAIAPYRHYHKVFSQMIEQGIAEGTLKNADPDASAQAILSMAVGLFFQGVLDPKGADWQKTASQSMQLLMDGLLKDPDATKSK